MTSRLATLLLLLYIALRPADAWSNSFIDLEFVEVPLQHLVSPPNLFGPKCPPPNASFQISKYEASNAEYIDFLNAVANTADPYGLYSPLQTEHFWGGIVRTQQGGRFHYSPKSGYAHLPVTFVSWSDAMRYANWFHHGRPKLQGGIRRLDEVLNHGAYEISDSMRVAGIHRADAARYFIPTCGEWRTARFASPRPSSNASKAAGSGPLHHVWDDIPEHGAANYYQHGWARPYPHLAEVDAYSGSASPLGTQNQGGNVMEWVETPIGIHQEMALGGSALLPEDALAPTYQDAEIATQKLSSFGFRIARTTGSQELIRIQIPEDNREEPKPSSALQKVRKVAPPRWLRIDRPGNFSDLSTGRGCVAQEYEIAQNEITNNEYVEFLNAVATTDDAHQLFIPDMSHGIAGGIQRTKSGPNWLYEASPGMGNLPAAYISWFSLARMANWLHFGKPKGPQAIGTTEGSTIVGAYDTSKFEDFQSAPRRHTVKSNLFQRNPGARYFIPTDDEWYKAAYYDPYRAGLNHYWRFPNRSDTPPSNSTANGFNYQTEHMGEGGPFFISPPGKFHAHGYYPANDMGGNLWEWLESWRGLGGGNCWRCDIPAKGLRGGSFNYIDVGLSKTNIDPGYPSDHYFVYGGRLARAVYGSRTGWCMPPHTRIGVAHFFNIHRKYIAIGAACISMALLMLYFKGRRLGTA